MLKHAYLRFIDRYELLAAGILLFLGMVLRLSALDALPFGLNQDEASAGYETFALLHSGIDRCGDPWPVLFTAWGSGQNVLMSYLAMPFVGLFGLSEVTLRLPNALAGCLTLLVVWRFARWARGPYFGITALLLLALNPWHIMLSRWALESNQLPFWLLLGLWRMSRARLHPRAMFGAAAALALSLYAYGAAFFFLPPFLVWAVVWLRRDIRRHPGYFIGALALFLLLTLPITLCQCINYFGWNVMHIFGITLPRLTEGRQAATTVFGGANALDNFRELLYILWTQSDGLPWNSMPVLYGGIYYAFGLPTAAVGFLVSLFDRKDHPEEAPMRAALVCGLICGFLIRVNINRINMLWLPMVYFSAVGCHVLLGRLGSWAAALPAVLLAGFVLFGVAYPRAFGRDDGGNVNYFPGLGRAVAYAASLDRGTVYVTNRVNQPYIFALFYTQTPPEVFVESVEYRDENAAFRQVKRFAGFEFDDPARAEVLILRQGETGDYRVLTVSGNFAVCAAEEP